MHELLVGEDVDGAACGGELVGAGQGQWDGVDVDQETLGPAVQGLGPAAVAAADGGGRGDEVATHRESPDSLSGNPESGRRPVYAAQARY